MKKAKVLGIIPARGGSKRIPNKNTRTFAGIPLVARAVKQALACSFVDRVILDTDSRKIAAIGKRAGAEVPFLRPKHLAGDSSQVIDSILNVLNHLKKGGYEPDYLLLLQPTSPLRDVGDVEEHWRVMKEEVAKKNGADSVLTVCATHPRLYHLDSKGYIHLGNKKSTSSENTQDWQAGFILNGCFAYIVKISALRKEHSVLTRKTRAIVAPRWRSVDLDYPEDWVIGEFLYKNRAKIERALKYFS